jgi:catechol 2,3-dioxygenase-like lactoylglutathione lyase family enzyme
MLDKALAHPTIFVRDLERARAFYENLGLKVTAETATGLVQGSRWQLRRNPRATAGVSSGGRSDSTPASHRVSAHQPRERDPQVFGSTKKNILENGIQARALITHVRDPGVTINEHPRVEFDDAKTQEVNAAAAAAPPDATVGFGGTQVVDARNVPGLRDQLLPSRRRSSARADTASGSVFS